MADDAATTDKSADSRDYRDTVFLPETPFPMRAGLPKLEPEILERWRREDLFGAMRKTRQAAGAPLFVLHDGPPYANGAIHIGHALNKILKDFVIRSRFLLGFDVDYTPGWDCHGLPIEWKIEEQYRGRGQRKDEVPLAEFRAQCRAFAGQWIEAQKDEFKRLGVLGRWQAPYATMDFPTEAAIVEEFHKFLMSGQLYRGSKPVMWSPVERTALADAEVEYHDHTSPTIWVRFPIVGYRPADDPDASDPWENPTAEAAALARHFPSLTHASIVIWTTTPWTIPGNRAIAFNPDIAYGLYKVEVVEEGLAFDPWVKAGDMLVVADRLADDVRQSAKIANWERLYGVDPTGLVCAHPFRGQGYDFDVPLLAGDHVTEDAGTGFVHTAPSHGSEDYQVWLASGRRDIPEMVDPDGAYYAHVPMFGGLKVLETEGKKAGKFGPANGAVMEKLVETGALLARGRLEHSYPHSWRSRAPVIFRNTPQWFIRMDETLADGATLRQRALAAVDATRFFPASGQNRLRGMVETRPDWLISRQRAWGTPLAMFVDKKTGEPLRDEAVNRRITEAVRKEGADAWFVREPAEFLGPGRSPADYEQVHDILDVWFDSGSTHAFTIEGRADSHWPADLYLEGSDQHRGWFQSSLLESCGTRSRAPYEAVLTHGFTLTEQGEKMSKSLGNAVEPDVVVRESGAEILRLWVAMVDYEEDQRIGRTILQTTVDAYRKLRNTVRYLLGGLGGFTEAERVSVAEMPPLERFILHRLWELDGQVRTAYEGYRFQDVWRPVAEFCSNDLSALYFDVRKDVLYCDGPDSLRRRACRTVMDLVFERLSAWLAPLAPFTLEEAWTTRFPDGGSNCLRTIPETPDAWRNTAEAGRWERIGKVLVVVTGALEIERREKRIGGALEAAPRVWIEDPELLAAFEGVDPAEVFRTSEAEFGAGKPPDGAFRLSEAPGVAVDPTAAQGCKCARCWRVLPEVKAERGLCLRCEAVLADRHE